MAEETVVAPTPEAKPGWKTTEFWKNIVVTLLGVLTLTGYITPEEASNTAGAYQSIAGGIMVAITNYGYATSRGRAKQSIDIAQVMAVLAAIVPQQQPTKTDG